MKIFSKQLILCLCAQWFVSAQEPPVVLTPRLINELAEEARTNNAALWANRARIVAAEENAKSIPLWRDPELMAGGMTGDQAMRNELGDIIYGVQQPLPVFGKEKAAREAAQTDVGVERADLEYQFQMLRKALAQALINAALSDEVLVLSRQDLAWLETLVTTVEQRYQTGDASQVDVLRVQNERSKRLEELRNDENMRHSAYVSVNRLLNRNLMAGWSPMQLPPIPGPVPFTERLLGYASKFDPKLRMMQKQVTRAQAMVDQSRKGKRPDLSAAVEGRNYSGNGHERSAEVVLKMTIPWFNKDKYGAAIRRDEAKVKDIENQIDDYVHGLRADVHHMTARVDAARREAFLYRDQIIPRSEQALRSAEAAWQASRDAFRDVLEARRMLVEARLMYARAVAEAYNAMSELILCCGIADFEALEMLGKQDQIETENP
jgi:outer membrane protein TolC